MEASNMTSLLLQVENLDSLWIPSPSSHPFHGSKLVNFTETQGDDDIGEKSFFSQLDKEDNDNENDSCFQQPGKKRRLSVTQVQFLERSFEVEDKLEPDRKLQLAKEIGLQPRQVAIWFQNRRARYKTKQLEKDYGCLKSSYDKLLNDYDNLLKENDNLKNKVHLLTEQLVEREKGNSLNDESEKTIPGVVLVNESSEIPVVVKQEGASSTISEVFDSDSSGGSGNQSSFQERPDGYTHDYEAEPSDFSQDEDDSLSRSLLQPPYFPKLEDVCNDIPGNSCMLEFPIEEDQTTWLWPY